MKNLLHRGSMGDGLLWIGVERFNEDADAPLR